MTSNPKIQGMLIWEMWNWSQAHSMDSTSLSPLSKVYSKQQLPHLYSTLQFNALLKKPINELIYQLHHRYHRWALPGNPMEEFTEQACCSEPGRRISCRATEEVLRGMCRDMEIMNLPFPSLPSPTNMYFFKIWTSMHTVGRAPGARKAEDSQGAKDFTVWSIANTQSNQ